MLKLLILLPLLGCNDRGANVLDNHSNLTTHHHHYTTSASVIMVPLPFPVYSMAEKCP